MSKELDVKAHFEAKKFLLNNTPDEVTEEIIESYLSTPSIDKSTITLNKVFEHLIEAAQTPSMKPGVIGNAIGGVKNFAVVLFDFDPYKVCEEYNNNIEKLLDDIYVKLNPKGKFHRTPNSIWSYFCKTILTGAKFLTGFKDSIEFVNWVNKYYENEELFFDLPHYIGEQVFGFGFTLACEFLKELGFEKYGKPDVHIRDLFIALGLANKYASDYQLLEAIIRVSENVGVSAYNVDKVFWLIGSGYFYNNKNIGKNGKIPPMKKAFIAHWVSMTD